jgi:hypothetical protein
LKLAGGVWAGGGSAGEALDYDYMTGTYQRDPSRTGSTGTVWGSFTAEAAGGIVVPSTMMSTPMPTPSPTSMPVFNAAFVPPPTPVEVPTELVIDAHWLNDTKVTIESGATVYSSQSIVNEGTLDIASGASIRLGTHDHYTDTFTAGGVPLVNGTNGTITGAGTIDTDLVNMGRVAPGNASNAIGTLTVTGNFTQHATGSMAMDIAANTTFLPGVTYDQLVVGGTAVLDGQMFVNGVPEVPSVSGTLLAAGATRLATTATPSATQYYEVLHAAGSEGQFSLISGPTALVSQIRMNIGGNVVNVPGLTAGDLQVLLQSPEVLAALNQILSESLPPQAPDLFQDDDEDPFNDRKSEGDIAMTDSACKPS